MRTNRTLLVLAALSMSTSIVFLSPRTARAGDVAAPAPALAPQAILHGARGGAFDGREISFEIYGWSHSVVSPRDAETGLTGHRQHSPIRITKRIDAATPLLAKALVESEVIPSVELWVPQSPPSADGTTEHFFTVEILEGRIVAMETEVEVVRVDDGNMKHEVREHVSIVYEKIVWRWTDGGDEFETEDSLAVPIRALLEPSDATEAPENLAADDPTAAGGNCSNVCTEVAACCICKCFEDFSWPGNYACAAGCLVLDTALGEDDEGDALVFASPDGASPLSEPLLVDRRRSESVLVEAGVFSPRREAFHADRRVSRVYFEVVDVDSYMEAVAGGEPAGWSFAGSAEPTGATHVAELSILGMAEGPQLVRAVFVLADGSTAETMALLEIR